MNPLVDVNYRSFTMRIMEILYIAKDGTQFKDKTSCLDYELKHQLTFECDACNARGFTLEERTVVEELGWDGTERGMISRYGNYPIGGEVEKVVTVEVKCYYCKGTGYRDKPLRPKYKTVFDGYEDT